MVGQIWTSAGEATLDGDDGRGRVAFRDAVRKQAEALVGEPRLEPVAEAILGWPHFDVPEHRLDPARDRAVPSLELGEEVQSPLRSLKLRRRLFQIVKFSYLQPRSASWPANSGFAAKRSAEAKKVTVRSCQG